MTTFLADVEAQHNVADRVRKTIDSLLFCPQRIDLTHDEKNMAKRAGLAEVMYGRLTSTKFRKSAVDPETAGFAKRYIESAVAKGTRLRLYFLFGGYKQARLASAPYPDWSEVFTVQFALAAASAIESIYPPGVDIIYRGDELVVTLLDNYTRESREAYARRFNTILDTFRRQIPSERNISLSYELTAQTSPEKELFALMDKLYPKHEQAFMALPEELQQDYTRKSYRNQCWDGEQDLTELPESQKLEKARRAFIMHDAFLEADVSLADAYFQNGISISFRRGLGGTIHYGACSSSAVQFWAGEGFFNLRDDRVVPWILSYEQQQNIDYSLVKLPNNPFASAGLITGKALDNYRD